MLTKSCQNRYCHETHCFVSKFGSFKMYLIKVIKFVSNAKMNFRLSAFEVAVCQFSHPEIFHFLNYNSLRHNMTHIRFI